LEALLEFLQKREDAVLKDFDFEKVCVHEPPSAPPSPPVAPPPGSSAETNSEVNASESGTKRTAPAAFASSNEWAATNFKYDEATATYVCVAGGTCSKRKKGYTKGTSHQVWVSHLTGKEHKLEIPDTLQERKRVFLATKQAVKSASIKTHFAPVGNTKATQEELLVVAYAMHPVPYDIVDDPCWRAAHKDSLGDMHADKLGEQTIVYDSKLEKKWLAQVRGGVALELDGGKDVSGNKLIAFVIIYNGKPFIIKLVNTNDETLDSDYFLNLVKEIIEDFQLSAPDAVVLSVTMDNEAGPNLGVTDLCDEFTWLLHISCGPHTLELLMGKCFKVHSRLLQAETTYLFSVQQHL
jgi:hypothetical protein